LQVVLKEDVISLGVEGDIVNVADGYARNYLVPKGLAAEATPGVLKDLEYRNKAIAKKEETRVAAAEKEAKKFEGKKIKIEVEATEEGTLYGSVNIGDIAKLIEEKLKETVDKSKIVLTDHIKEVGTYPVTIRLHPKVEAKLNLEVVGKEKAGGKASE